MSYCDDCIHVDVCADEGCEDEALTFCADKIVLVRCKDCKWWGAERFCENSDSPCFQNGCTHGNWFCADGERKDADE